MPAFYRWPFRCAAKDEQASSQGGSPLSAIASGWPALWGAVGGVPRFAVAHAALLTVALLLWGVSLAEADLSRMAGIGLLNAMPATYFVAFGLLLVGFAVAVTRDQLPRKLLWLYLLALILVIHGTTALLYDEPRYAWTYKHLGVIDLIANSGSVDREVDIYNNWPGFFALNAWLSSVTGLASIAYAGWAQLFFNLANVAAVRFAVRGLTRDERLLWTATWLFVLGNWVGQDYLAPQAFGFLLSLVILGLCLRCSPAVKQPRRRWDRWRARSLDRLAGALLPDRAPDEPLPPVPLGPRAALAVGGLCFLAVVISHQFSPVLLILGVAALSLLIRRIPVWVAAAMVVIELWWVALSWPFVKYHFDLVDPGGAGVQAVGRDLSAAPPGAVLSFYAPAAVIAVIALLALIGAVGRLRAGKWDLAAACLIVAPDVRSRTSVLRRRGDLPGLPLRVAVACLLRCGSMYSPAFTRLGGDSPVAPDHGDVCGRRLPPVRLLRPGVGKPHYARRGAGGGLVRATGVTGVERAVCSARRPQSCHGALPATPGGPCALVPAGVPGTPVGDGGPPAS